MVDIRLNLGGVIRHPLEVDLVMRIPVPVIAVQEQEAADDTFLDGTILMRLVADLGYEGERTIFVGVKR